MGRRAALAPLNQLVPMGLAPGTRPRLPGPLFSLPIAPVAQSLQSPLSTAENADLEGKSGSSRVPRQLPPRLPIMSRIGMKMASTTPPTMKPMKVIRMGSMRLVRDLTWALTSES